MAQCADNNIFSFSIQGLRSRFALLASLGETVFLLRYMATRFLSFCSSVHKHVLIFGGFHIDDTRRENTTGCQIRIVPAPRKGSSAHSPWGHCVQERARTTKNWERVTLAILVGMGLRLFLTSQGFFKPAPP